jgi:pyruvyltransferase
LTQRAPIGLFWWSPRRVLRDCGFELKTHPSAWLRLLAATGRFMSNFGDELSRDVVGHLTGRGVRWAAPHEADAFAIGSVLQIALKVARPGAQIWGSGLREGLVPENSRLAGVSVLALRGEQTRAALGSTNDVLGDPGILAVEALGAPGGPRGGMGYVPHFTDYGSAGRRGLIAQARTRGFSVICPARPVAEVLAECARHDLILSSSLHGLVLADALGVPALAAVPGRGATEPRFKYQDYESIYGITDRPVELTRVASGELDAGQLALLAECRQAAVQGQLEARQQQLVQAIETVYA